MNNSRRLWISERIKELGKKKKDLAETLGLPHTRVSDIVGGTRALKLTEVHAFAEFMNMSYTEVLNRFSMKGTAKGDGVGSVYDGLINEEKEVIELYRGLSESGKQKFQEYVTNVKKTDS